MRTGNENWEGQTTLHTVILVVVAPVVVAPVVVALVWLVSWLIRVSPDHM